MEAVVLYSGGSDSTLTASSAATKNMFDKIHLVTYDVPFALLEKNSRKNIPRLESKFPQIAFQHEILDLNDVLAAVMKIRKWRMFFKYGLIEASLCLQCRLAMHARTIIYCIDNKINHAFDGSNICMAVWVDQTTQGLQMVDQLYADFGISVEHPIFHYKGNDDFDMLRFLDQKDLRGCIDKSTMDELCELGIMSDPTFKSDWSKSYRHQPVCFGSIMTLAHSLCYYMPLYGGYTNYLDRALKWYAEKLAVLRQMVNEYAARPEISVLGKHVHAAGS